ncbi:MAG TPA: sialidase family protein, partial [Ignavibacteriaceae bacterium]|nr:sialidase family protein [Ignavibacteriaceae bacterium]
MKKHSTLFWVLFLNLCLLGFNTFAQDGRIADDRIWSIVNIEPVGPGQIDPNFKWDDSPKSPQHYFFESGGITVGPNFRPRPTTNSTQSELSIDVHPSNHNIVFCSANASNWPFTTFYGTGVYWTLDGGTNWTTFDQPPFGSNSGDPASVIGTDGRFYENYITNSLGMGVSVSTNNGVNWTTHSVAPNPGQVADKNHYMVDKIASSPFLNRSYCTWTDFGGANDGHAVVRYSTNFGVNWSSSINLSNTLSPGSHAQGVNVQTGPGGEVYVTFAIYDNWPTGEDAIGFAKSTDGGVTWTRNRIYGALTPNGNFNFGIRGFFANKNGIRTASFPSMAVDKSGGPNNGNIYITWPQRGVSPAGNDPDIVLIKSTNGGTTWSAPIRINDDLINNVKDQYYPWATVDQSNGRVSLVWYDSRDVPNNQAEVFMAHSVDGGNTFI